MGSQTTRVSFPAEKAEARVEAEFLKSLHLKSHGMTQNELLTDTEKVNEMFTIGGEQIEAQTLSCSADMECRPVSVRQALLDGSLDMVPHHLRWARCW